MVLDKTPFYAEMGGQVADHGTITCGDDGCFEVSDVQKNKGGKYMHYGVVKSGTFRLGDTVTASIDVKRRRAICRSPLRDPSAPEGAADGAGRAMCTRPAPWYEPDKLRFDFTHFSAVTPEELFQIERLVNHAVLAGGDVVTDVMSHGGGQEAGRHGPVRGEVRRHRSGGSDEG